MPSIITHCVFGETVYESLKSLIGESEEERNAFIIGNQGPDPLFYAAASAKDFQYRHLGSIMHSERTNDLLAAFKDSLQCLTEEEKPIGRAYALGFLCHYLLDSSEHPLIFSQQYAICGAGVENLDETDGSEVHSTIETEIDEMILFTHTGLTVDHYSPEIEALRASDFTLDVISKQYQYIMLVVYQTIIPIGFFKHCLKRFRLVQSVFHSKSGKKRLAFTKAEGTLRRYSFYCSMSHKAVKRETTVFTNDNHETWIDPDTNIERSESFQDLWDTAYGKVGALFAAFNADNFNADVAKRYTQNLDFSGESLQ